ncbi:Cna B-type domain-containing protein [Periweissella ghanensis]|uniref:Cna B-type domain-containing protein n=1 Tax=Periweissella ghanensis TaxID=467997 RepID=A0ABM8Z927_9LACO|nr:Cna B-type domain-containing protein [Periweissella ghanensis]MCM0601117.1 Cna B-type domain-containing protein [Periweissella ghanensis]CAH0417800.1 hypothetical protein WGH24286_00215 [Periweissella ghanensis]
MTKRAITFFNLLVLLGSFLVIPLTTLTQTSVSAAGGTDWGDQFITKAELEDQNGNTKDSFFINENMQANWSFNIPKGTAIKAGDTMTVPIPTELHATSNVAFPIVDASGKTIGNAIADPTTGKLVITFTQEAADEAQTGITGNFNVFVKWDASKVKDNTVVPLDWGKGGKSSATIKPSSGPNAAEVLAKSGYVDPADPTTIHWTVRINFAQQDIKNGVYTDTVGPNQKFNPSSVSAKFLNHDPGQANYTVDSNVPTSSIVTDSDQKFHINFGDFSKTAVIYYTTTATDNGASATYENAGALTGENIQEVDRDVQTPKNGGGGNSETTTFVRGAKIWDDTYNADNVRPQSITVNLLANGKQIATKQVTAETAYTFNTWFYSFTDLPKYDANKKLIVYTVTEDSVPNYSSKTILGNEGTSINFANTYTPGQTSISVTKAWNDQNNQDGTRPSSIQVQLYRNGQAQNKPATLNAANNWSFTWDQLPEKSAGDTNTYTVKEVNVPTGYASVITGDATNGYMITNNHTAALTTINVVKSWHDNGNQDGTRPQEISVQLYDGTEKIGAPITLSAANNWKGSWQNLPKYSDGKLINYSAKEVTVPQGYVEKDGVLNNNNTIIITNSYKTELTEIKVIKDWHDEDNQDGSRPQAITVNLVVEGKIIASQKVTAATNWQATFSDLDKYHNGQPIDYTVTENAVAGYTSEVVKNADGSFTITNTHTPKKDEPVIPDIEPTNPDDQPVTPNDDHNLIPDKDANGNQIIDPTNGQPEYIDPTTNQPGIIDPKTHSFVVVNPVTGGPINGTILPKTDEQKATWLVVLGAGLLVIVSGLFWFLRKNK